MTMERQTLCVMCYKKIFRIISKVTPDKKSNTAPSDRVPIGRPSVFNGSSKRAAGSLRLMKLPNERKALTAEGNEYSLRCDDQDDFGRRHSSQCGYNRL
jgi:hypothetical protein